MFLLLFLLWLVFNGRLAIDVVVSGLLVSGALTWFAYRFCKWNFERDRQCLLLIPQLAAFVGLLVWEIMKANLQVIRLILSPNLEQKIQPQIVQFEVPLRSEITRTFLANAITLTPGTITVRLRSHHYVVHALVPEMGQDMDQSSFAKALKRIDEGVCRSKWGKEDDSSHVS